MADKRIMDLTEVTEVSSDQNLALDSSAGTRRITLANFLDTTLEESGKPADAKTVGDALATKVDAVDGKGLSTEDFTSAEKTKLSGIQAEANKTVIDDTLSNTGQAADAKAVGDEIADVKSDLEHIGLSDSVKVALLDCFANVAWTDEHGQEYYDTLEAALYEGEYPRLTADFAPGTHVVYTDDDLSTLKPYLSVKLYQSADDPGTVIPPTDYTLSGTLTEGQNVVRVSYNDVSTTFTLTAVDFYNIWEWTSPELLQVDSLSAGRYNNTCGYSDPQTGYPRKSVWAYRGKTGAYNNSTQQIDNTRFPIPIPSSATNINLVISSADNIYHGIVFWGYDDSTGTYSKLSDNGWSQAQNITIPQGKYISINMKNGTAGNADFTETPIVTITYS